MFQEEEARVMIKASHIASYTDSNCNGDNGIGHMQTYIEDTIFTAAKHGFYRTIVYLGSYYSDEEIKDMRQYFESLGYSCHIDNNNLLEIVW